MEQEKLRELGFNLFPLKSMSKEPIAGLNWKQFQSEKYTGEFPESCNIAVICGGISNNLFVIDLDSFDIYDDIPDWMKETYTVKTGKGYHLYYRYHGFAPQNKKLDDQRFRHIDIKSEGGYVLSSGSIHPTTKKPYETFKDLPIKEIELDKIKTTLGELGFKFKGQTIEEIKKGSTQGNRNNNTFMLSCHYCREEGLAGDALRQVIEEYNKNKNKPPLPQVEIDTILSQSQRYHAKEIKNHMKEAEKIIGTEEDRNPIELKIQEIDPRKHEDVLLKFDCMITAVGERKTYIKRSEMHCPVCDKDGLFICDEYYNFYVPKCKQDKIKFVFDKKETAYIQQIIIEEFLEDSRNSSPIVFDAEITNENVGEAFMGERKTVTARFRSIPDGKGRNTIVFDIEKMENIEQQFGCLPEDEEVEEWKKCENFFDRVTASVLPDLMMDVNVIQSAILYGAGGTGLNGKREDINLAIIGDAQLGKSELDLRMHKILVGSGMTVGGKTSGAGLTIGMVKTHNGMLIPRAGFFPQYTGHHTIIDEGDKMSQPDQDSCLEVMEQGTCTLTKVGIPSMTLPAQCPLLFTGNPKGGKFNDKYPTVMDNFNMQVPFISRYDLVWVLRDQNDPELDSITRKFIRSFKDRQEQYMKLDELQRYFSYVQSLTATIPEELMDKIDELHTKMRPLNQQNGLPIGWRQYHGLYRLITASAKAHLRTEATQEDFDLVEKIITMALQSMRMDINTGEVGEVVKSKNIKEKVFLETIGELQDEFHSVDKDEFIEELSKKSPFNKTVNGAEVIFQQYLKNGKSFEIDNDTGRYTWKGSYG